MKTASRKGRPPKGSAPLTERFEMRMTKAERKAFEVAAELAGVDLSSWIRMMARTAAHKSVTGQQAASGRLPDKSRPRRNNIVAKDPWGEYGGAFEDNAMFDEVMDIVEQERQKERNG